MYTIVSTIRINVSCMNETGTFWMTEFLAVPALWAYSITIRIAIFHCFGNFTIGLYRTSTSVLAST